MTTVLVLLLLGAAAGCLLVLGCFWVDGRYRALRTAKKRFRSQLRQGEMRIQQTTQDAVQQLLAIARESTIQRRG